jgi:cobalt/nickel transport protein
MLRKLSVTASLLLLSAASASAHFQELLPSQDVLSEGGSVSLNLLFTHPMAGKPVMEMVKPKRFGVLVDGKVQDLTATLKEKKVDGKTAWDTTHDLKKPGAAVFFVEPQRYWEPAENKWITHYAKVVVDAYASGEGWNALVGLPVEIQPLTRPTGLWTGNEFRGIVLRDGKPVPFAEIEVEFVNDGSIKAPNEAFDTQVITADQNGVFGYAMPRAGWWGFAALVDGDKTLGPDGKEADTEIGGLMWVKTTDMK